MVSKTRVLALVRAFQWRDLQSALAERPSLIQERDGQGRNWLHILCSVNVRKRNLEATDSIRTAMVLLEAGIDVDEPAATEGTWKATPLWYSIAHGENIELATWLLQRGCDPDHCLWAAVNRDSASAIELLFSHGAPDPGTQDDSLLTVAIQWNRFRAAEALVNLGADVNFQDSQSMTALHYLLKKRAGIGPVKMLIANGARGDIRNAKGETAAQIMLRKRDPGFRQLGARLERMAEAGRVE